MRKQNLKAICPCQSQNILANCCGPYLEYRELPQTPELLMRSRYTAFFLKNFDYIKKTMRGKALENFSLKEALNQSKNSQWISLEIIKSSIEENKNAGTVEFKAQYKSYGKIYSMHENSLFEYYEGKWYYVSGEFL